MAVAERIPKTITLVGCGSMGSAMLRGWLKSSQAPRIQVVAPHREAVEPYLDTVEWCSSPEELPGPVECLVIAVKPFVLDEVLPQYEPFVTSETTVITVATGKTLSYYKDMLGQGVIRAMPNTPVSINQGVIGLCAAEDIRRIHGTQAESLLNPLGYVSWVKGEDQLNQVTALSGSGPAYVFYMIEAMAAAGVSMGLDADQAYDMALHTVAGAGAYALESGVSAATLRENVTSPQGTTEQALNELMGKEGLAPLMKRAISRALKRAEELAK